MKVDPKLVAFHEAGHVVAAISERVPIRYVSIEPDEESLGRCSIRKFGASVRPDVASTPQAESKIRARIIALLGGHVGAELWSRRSLTPRQALSHADWAKATQLAYFVNGSTRQVDAYLQWLRECTRDLIRLQTNRLAIRALAAALVNETRIGAGRAREIVARAQLGDSEPIEIISLIDGDD